MTTRRWTTAFSCAAAAAMLLTANAVRAEEQVVEAFSVYESSGELTRTGEDSATFVGTMAGLFFVRTPEGPSRPATITCPGSIEVDLENGLQTGKGKCTIVGRDERGSVFADWTCTGYHLIGCRGDFTLTGGTDRFEGITGGGTMTVRGDVHEIAIDSAETISRTTQGIVFWKELRFTIPE